MIDIVNNGLFALICALAGIGALHLLTVFNLAGSIVPAGY